MKLFIHSEYIYFDILQISKTTSKCSKYKRRFCITKRKRCFK